MVGGGIFPFEFLPEAISAVGRRMPNGWALNKLRTVLFGGIDPAGFAIGCAFLVAALAILAAWLGHRVQRSFGVPR